MTTPSRTATRSFLILPLALTFFGCAEPQPVPQTTTTTVRTTKKTQTTQVISLKIGMKARDAIAQAGIPCSPDTIKEIDGGADKTLMYQGHSYVFSKGLLQAVR